jgi:hypothetical protein
MRKLTVDNAPIHGRFLAKRYKDKPNIVWINGGDTDADMATLTWRALGGTSKSIDHNPLTTFHPFARTDSCRAFHNAKK